MIESNRTMLIFEPNLVENSGHHYTQIDALSHLFPEFSVKLVAGENYSGFLGDAVGHVNPAQLHVSRLRKKAKSVKSFKRHLYTIRLMWHLILRRVGDTPYGDVLLAAYNRLGLGKNDVIIVPSADLDSLESTHWLATSLGAQCPKIALRFLTPDLGEDDDVMREMRLNTLQPWMSKGALKLFTETNEMATFLSKVYGISFSGGFYLPCNFNPLQLGFLEKHVSYPTEKKQRYIVGLFGLPKRRKGSRRLANILAALEQCCPRDSDNLIEFVVQGSIADFSSKGLYCQLSQYNKTGSRISVRNIGERLSPTEFREVFSSVDMVMLPYDISQYGLQGSGIIQDAISALKPIIYSQGMAMSDLLSEKSSISAITDVDFAKAVLKVIQDMDLLESSVFHTAEYYKDMLLQNPLRRHL